MDYHYLMSKVIWQKLNRIGITHQTNLHMPFVFIYVKENIPKRISGEVYHIKLTYIIGQLAEILQILKYQH